MSTETPAGTTPPATETPTPSTPSTPANSDAAPQPPVQPAAGDKPNEGTEGKAPAAEGDLLFGEKKADTPPEKPPVADQKKYLESKVDPKTLEGKTDEEIAKLFDEQQAKDAADAEKPVEYTDFDLTKAPEGVEIAPEQVAWLKEFAGTRKMSQEDAQALVDKGIEMQQKNLDFWNDTKKQWRDQVKADPVLGGQNLTKSVETAEKIVAQFGGTPEQIKEMQDDLQLLGLGNKRSFIRFLNNIAAATSDDKAEGGSGAPNAAAPKNLAQMMWPNMPGDKK